MAHAVAEALIQCEHLLVQAGTGTGKSLGYLVPAVAHAMATGVPVVVSTATLALQAQIVDRDLPRVADALGPALGRRPTWQLLKGRRNYLCRHKLDGGFPEEELPLDVPASATSRLGRDVLRLREWAGQTRTGDRDEVVPGVLERAWRQVSVSAEECLGAQRCPQAGECFSELAREQARAVDVIVANHSYVAIDAFGGRQLLPEHDILIVDEAHELADRVTSAITDELTVTAVEVAARRARRAGVADTDALDAAAERFGAALEECPVGRLPHGLPEPLASSVAGIRDAARALGSALAQRGSGEDAGDVTADGARQQARAALGEIFEVAERLTGPEASSPDGADVVWVSRFRRGDGPERATVNVAPLSVAGLIRERMFAERTAVLTSATLSLGGTFDAAAAAVGLAGEGGPAWRGLDVGSPFDYTRQAMLYVARHLPSPGRDGLSTAMLDELAALIDAAGGRTLGLFSSRRAAEDAADEMRERLDLPILCQGDDSTPTLVREFASDPRTCLFGTLSLWQGVDVPGSASQLVVIDRIPFPRPDDPLMAARQQAVARAGGNGFMAVAATHAALRLAQGVGRLVRTGTDRGVVAVLDPRLVTARYGSFLRASLPPFWATTERDVVLQALRRIDASAPPVLPVQLPPDRAVGAAVVEPQDSP